MENTVDRGSQLDEEDEDDKEEEDEEEEEERRRRGGGEEEEDQATDIKSNNPHLAGGEKCHDLPSCCRIVQGRSRNCSPFCSVHKGARP